MPLTGGGGGTGKLRTRAGQGGEAEKEVNRPDSPHLEYNGHGRDRIMDTKPRCPSGFLQQKARLIGRL